MISKVVFVYLFLLFWGWRTLFFFFVAKSAPNSENTTVSARNSQAMGALSVLKIAPIIRNVRQSKIAEIVPDIKPQSSVSRPLFFRVAINPPKKEEEYMAKNERGVR